MTTGERRLSLQQRRAVLAQSRLESERAQLILLLLERGLQLLDDPEYLAGKGAWAR